MKTNDTKEDTQDVRLTLFWKNSIQAPDSSVIFVEVGYSLYERQLCSKCLHLFQINKITILKYIEKEKVNSDNITQY